jgi:hypothetical protein
VPDKGCREVGQDGFTISCASCQFENGQKLKTSVHFADLPDTMTSMVITGIIETDVSSKVHLKLTTNPLTEVKK